MRLRLLPIVVAAALASRGGLARAELDGETFTSTAAGVRLDAPRGWRASEASGYPRVLLRLSRSTPPAKITIAIDRIVPGCLTAPDAVFCSSEPNAAAAQLRTRLDGLGVRVTAQQQSRTPELEYEANRRYVRHALIIVGDQVVSVVLSTNSSAARASLRTVFDRLVESVRPLPAR
ncbi:MAG: hypothetical protein R3B06_31470 [Kofleriaceae bacterium]